MTRFFKYILILAVCFYSRSAIAQRGFDFAQYDIGLGGSLNKTYSDAETFTNTKSAHFTFTYNTTPFVNYVLEVQTGNLEGGDSLKTATGRQFKNEYAAVMFRGQLQLGEIMDYSNGGVSNILKNFYLSTGVGFSVNKLVNTSRYSPVLAGFYTPGRDNSTEILIPARIGYEIKFFNKYDQPNFKIDLAYQNNFMLGDALDGYEVGKQKDSFSQISIGLKLAIGGITSYRKQVSY